MFKFVITHMSVIIIVSFLDMLISCGCGYFFYLIFGISADQPIPIFAGVMMFGVITFCTFWACKFYYLHKIKEWFENK